MIRAVLDSNIYISGILFGGKPAQILRLARTGAYQLLVSQPLQTEVARVLREKFAWPEDRLAEALDLYWPSANIVDADVRVQACIDPNDDRVLECAVSGGASVIVTGDHHLLDMTSFRGAEMLTATEFLSQLGIED